MAVYENKCVLANKRETFQTESLGLRISRVILKCLIQFAATQKYRQATEYKYNEESTLRVNYLTIARVFIISNSTMFSFFN